MIATSGFLTALECTKSIFGRGSAPDPAGGAYSAPPVSLAGFNRGPTSKEREGRGGNGREGRGRERKGRGREGEGKEGRGGEGGDAPPTVTPGSALARRPPTILLRLNNLSYGINILRTFFRFVTIQAFD